MAGLLCSINEEKLAKHKSERYTLGNLSRTSSCPSTHTLVLQWLLNPGTHTKQFSSSLSCISFDFGGLHRHKLEQGHILHLFRTRVAHVCHASFLAMELGNKHKAAWQSWHLSCRQCTLSIQGPWAHVLPINCCGLNIHELLNVASMRFGKHGKHDLQCFSCVGINIASTTSRRSEKRSRK